MKIVNVMISPLLGGIEQAFLDYTQALTLNGHQVIDIIERKAQIKEKIPLAKLNKLIEIPFLHYNYFLLPYLYFKLKKFAPDLIIVHNKKAIPIFRLAAKLLNAKIIGVSHNPKYRHINTCDGIFTITQYQKGIFAAKGFPADKIFVVPNLIAQNLPFKPVEKFHNPPIIGTMGRFDPMKGFSDFIQALAIIYQRGIEFNALIGGGVQKSYADEYEKLREQINNSGLQNNVKFYGWVQDKKAFFESIDIFVLPSRYEPFGIVLLEAMMHSKPVVSSLAEGPAEIYKDTPEAAYLFMLENPQDMADKLETALNNFSKSQAVAKAGYELCQKNYTLEKVAQTLNDAVLTFRKGR